MGAFDELKEQVNAVNAAERARQEEARARQMEHESQQRDRQRRMGVLSEKVFKPALNELVRELGLKDAKIIDVRAKVDVAGTQEKNRPWSFRGLTVTELTFVKPPATPNFQVTGGLVFAVSDGLRLYLFSGTKRGVTAMFEQKPFTESGISYKTGHDIEIDATGDLDEGQLAAIRAKVNVALVDGMKKIMASS